jgi:cell wall-associated NlpC family hydrolase
MTGGDAEVLGGTDVTPRYRQLAAVALALLCIGAGTLVEVPAATAATGQSIVEEAAKWAGTPYCWDGGNQNGPTPGTRDPENGLQCGVGGYEPPGTVGFDCTGLTLYAVYQATGILLPHGKGQESVPGGTPVARSELQPGDLVFFGPSLANYSHAGVYAGGGKMWDAQNEGVPVQLHSLYSDYVGAERYWHESGPPGEGSFVSHAGFVYRIAGGAPIYVSNWATVGGAQPTTPLSDAQFAALPQYPRDGTFLGASGGGVFVSRWRRPALRQQLERRRRAEISDRRRRRGDHERRGWRAVEPPAAVPGRRNDPRLLGRGSVHRRRRSSALPQ